MTSNGIPEIHRAVGSRRIVVSLPPEAEPPAVWWLECLPFEPISRVGAVTTRGVSRRTTSRRLRPLSCASSVRTGPVGVGHARVLHRAVPEREPRQSGALPVRVCR